MKVGKKLLFLGAVCVTTAGIGGCGGGGEARDYTLAPAGSRGGAGGTGAARVGGPTGAGDAPGASAGGRGGGVMPSGGTSGATAGSAAGGAAGAASTGGEPAGGAKGGAPAGGSAGATAAGGATGATGGTPAGGATGGTPAGGTTGGTPTGGTAGGMQARGGTGGTPAGGTSGGTTPPAPTPDAGAGVCGACTKWSDPVPHGQLPDVLPELSGLAASPRYPGLLYTHNDSGDSARFFVMDENAALIAEMRLGGATAVDWEDIAVGPCPSGSCVYLGDIGDGSASRPDYTIHRVAEPASRPASGSVTTVSYESFRFLYPDDGGRHNAEALLVHPQSGRVFVIIKMGGRPSVYELPQPLVPGSMQTLVNVGTLRLPQADSIVTGADFHPCGDRMLVRTTGSLYELSAPGEGVDALFAATPVEVPVAAQEPQGEAVTYSPDGRRYFTSSETGNDPQPLNIVSCVSP